MKIKKFFYTSAYAEAENCNFENDWTQWDDDWTLAFVEIREHKNKVVISAWSYSVDVEYKVVIKNGLITKVLKKEHHYDSFDRSHSWEITNLPKNPYLEWVDDEGNIVYLEEEDVVA